MNDIQDNSDSESSDILTKTSDRNCKSKKCSLFLIPLLTYLLLFHRSMTNTPFLIFFISVITFWNFPIIVTFSNSKPLYYEDLFINTQAIPKLDIEYKTIEYFKNIYHYFIIFTNSILTSILVQYWLFKTKNTDSIYEMIGITGGILQIFKVVNNYTGLFILKIIKFSIKNNIQIHADDVNQTEEENYNGTG